MIVIKFIFDIFVDPVIMSTPEKKLHIISATGDLFIDVAFNADASLTPHFGHNWKQTNRQVTVSFRFFMLIFCTIGEKMIILTGGDCVDAELVYQRYNPVLILPNVLLD
jgi:hypothetical protein